MEWRGLVIGRDARIAALNLSKSSDLMYHHVKKLMYTVRVDEPDPRFGNMLLEQFGGANGELAAARRSLLDK